MPVDASVEDLTPAEIRLLAAVTTGRVLDLRQASLFNDREIRGSVITRLVTAPSSLGVEGPIALRVRGAHVREQINLGSRKLICPLELVDCEISKPVVLTKAVASNINLRGSIVHGLYANFIRISETLNIGGGFTCHGQTKLFGAEIGELEAEGGVFSNSKGFSINADYIRVHGFATLERSRHLGTLRMLGAQIDGQLDCSSVKFQAPLEGDAITLDSASIQGGVVFDEAQIRGPVWLVGLKAEGELSFQRAIVEQPSHRAIDGSSMRVRNVNFTDATIRGEVKIVAADLLSLDCYGARFVDPGDSSLDLDSTTIAGAFHAMFQQIEGRLDLTNTSMSIYRDTQQAWPPDARLIGARYNKLEGDEDALDRDRADIRTRLSWLKLDGRYHPQKYLALATAYQNVGQEAFGRRVLMSSEAERRVAGKHGLVWLLATVWSWMLRSIVGYGFSPARAVWWLLGLIGFGSLLTTLAKQAGLISALPKTHVDFNSVRYTVSLLFPVANLPDSQAFTTHGPADWLAFFLSVAGWFLAAVVVAALTGLLQRTR